MHTERDPRQNAIPDIHGHAKGEHKLYAEERPLPLTARMLFLWFYHACRRGHPRFMMVTDHMNALTFEDPASVNLVRRALKLAQAGDLYGAAETANVDVGHAQVVSEGLRRGMRYSIGAEVDNDPRARPDAQNIVEAMKPDGLIRSVHFIPIDHPVHGAGWNWPFDNPEFASMYEHVGTEKTWEIYMGVLLDALERLPGHIVGHFYVPAILGHWPDAETLEKYEDQMLDIVEQKGMAVEFNTRFLYRDHTDEEKQRYLDANKRMLRKAKDRGIGIAIGSDAHSPRDQGGCFDQVLAVLDELDINEIVFPIGGRLLRVALRYVKPPEPEPAPPPPPPPAPEPVPVTAAVAAPPDAVVADAPAKPVRKARPAASSTRPKESAPERIADEKPFVPASDAEGTVAPDVTAEPDSAPAPPKKPRPPRTKAVRQPADTPAPAAAADEEEATPPLDAAAPPAVPDQSEPAETQQAAEFDPAPAPDAVATENEPAPETEPAAATEPAFEPESETEPPAAAVKPAPVKAPKSPVPAKAVPSKDPAPPKTAPVAAMANSVVTAAAKAVAAVLKPSPAKSAPKPVPAKTAAKSEPAKATVAPPVAAKAPVKKAPAAAKRAPSKTAPAKKAPPKKSAAPVKKTALKKAAPKKAVAVKKATPAKKAAPAKKAPLKKASPKKAPVKKPVAAKKPAAKAKAPAKKTAAKKAAKRR